MRRGEVWALGRHRLMCGDATSRADVQRLIHPERAAMVFTDPPYGVSYEAKSGKHAVIEGDRERDDGLLKLLSGALKQAAAASREDAAFYVWHASSTRREFDDALRAAGLVERQYIIWDKGRIVLGHSDYRWAHEPCYYASRAGVKPAFHGGRDQSSVWRAALRTAAEVSTVLGQGLVVRDGAGDQIVLTPSLAKGKKVRQERLAPGQVLVVQTAREGSTLWEVKHDRDYIHPTQKPVELARRAIENSSLEGEVVLDLFGGSGTTIIGAEVTGRCARVMEVDPKYCGRSILRWELLTGGKAVRQP